ncbi:hypothetical protein QTG54_015645 [Skeletonema marinoi]|uniref:Uncharacterized protein n=1 Tax=Skeletonema marinoi TaxID=267567 RepID=A0AAD9D4N1_9STRA|nr:hypothetical protein QTG54_015645 [Skeletonema marinoi]
MATNLKRKANDSGDAIEDCQLSLLDEQLGNPLVYVGSFLTGKDFSTFLSASISSRHVKDHALRTHLVSVFVDIHKSMTDRCNVFLSNIAAPTTMVTLFNDRSTNLKRAIDTLRNYMYPNLPRIMNAVSEWSALLDYCELLPLRLSKARLDQDGPTQPLWIVGAGEFGSTKSPSILSVPSQTWRPGLVFMAEKWMVDCPRGYPYLQYDISSHLFSSESIAHGAAVMSWKDGDYLAHMHREIVDITAGGEIYHEFPVDFEVDDNAHYSLLSWIPKANSESPMGENVRVALGNSESLNWMLKGTKFDNNMLAIMQIEDEGIPEDHMDGFYVRIIKLMVEAEQWM